jgi:hypothetical protein
MPAGDSLCEQVRRRLANKELFLINRMGRSSPEARTPARFALW